MLKKLLFEDPVLETTSIYFSFLKASVKFWEFSELPRFLKSSFVGMCLWKIRILILNVGTNRNSSRKISLEDKQRIAVREENARSVCRPSGASSPWHQTGKTLFTPDTKPAVLLKYESNSLRNKEASWQRWVEQLKSLAAVLRSDSLHGTVLQSVSLSSQSDAIVYIT